MKRYIYLFIFTLISIRTWAQSSNMNVELARLEFKAKQVIPPAPEAAELGRYGNTPVSLFAGTTNISIPLYELKGLFLSLPISMSYNASGFKPEDPATWVGLNWSLNAGGVVARSVSGNPDTETNYFGTNNLTFPNSGDLFEAKDFMHDMKIGIRETDPDFYSYNFPGGAGKFFLMPDYSVLKKDRNNLKITGCFNCTTSYTQIVDEQGSTYTFADAETTRLLLNDDEGSDAPVITGYNYPSSWYLSTITSVNGREKLLFEYYTTGEHLLTQNTQTNKSVTYSTKATLDKASPTTFDSYAYTNQPPATYTKRKFLKRVTLLRDGRIISYVDFQSASNMRLDTDFSEIRLLQGIKVYSTLNNVSKLVKNDTLYYSYFNNNSNTFTKNRLRLDSLKELPVGAATIKPPYRFEYNTDGSMPERFPYALDHWGFYNASNNQTLVPTVVFDGQTYGDGANREPSLAGSSYGILNKISYPTGGYTTFDYELNEGLYTNYSRKVGGLRIKQITDYAAVGQKATAKIYEYRLENDSTSGLSDVGYPQYLTLSRFDHIGTHVDGQNQNPSYTIWKKTISANSIFGLGTFHGSHIAYSRVTESAVDVVSGTRMGKTVYEYNTTSFNPYDEDIRNGDLLKQTTFDNNGNVLEEQNNSYTYTNIGGINMAKLRTEFAQTENYFWCRQGTVYSSYAANSISPPTSCDEQRVYYYNTLMDKFVLNAQQKQQTQQTVKKYDQLTNSYLTSTRKFTYGSTAHTYPTLIEDYTTGNEEVVTRKKYAGDYVIPTGTLLDNTAKGIVNLQTNNMLTTEVESAQYRQNLDSSNRRFISGQITNYGSFYPFPVSTYRLETAVPLSSLNQSTINGSGAFISDSHYKPLGVFGYDGSGNLTEQAKANDAIQAFVWDYNDSYPVAAINNANRSNIAYTSFETDTMRSAGGWKDSSVTVIATYAMTGKRSCNLSSGRVYKLFTTAIAKPMIVAYWSRNGAVTVKQNNTTNIAAATTGSTVNGWTYYEHLLPASTLQVSVSGVNVIIDELRLYPDEAQMTTYTYEPFVGLTSQTDAKGMPVSYEYDGYNRLINIKDESANIRQNMKYNYGTGGALAASTSTLFYNRDTSVSLSRATCTAGEPEIVTYKVPAGKYISAVSQADVNAKAGLDLTTNGQAYANTNGNCFFYNTVDSVRGFKNDCPPNGFLPLPVLYRVAARKWRSPVSQAEADTLAKHDLRDNAQAYANANGICPCQEAGKKVVNGVCTTGTRVNIGSWRQSDGQWKCVYVYHFDADNTDSDEYTEYSASQCPVL